MGAHVPNTNTTGLFAALHMGSRLQTPTIGSEMNIHHHPGTFHLGKFVAFWNFVIEHGLRWCRRDPPFTVELWVPCKAL